MEWNHGAGEDEFVLYGCSTDFRLDKELEESRDPFYAGVDPKDESVGWDEKRGQYMQPWYVPLSRLGNHGVVLILNMKNRKFLSICFFQSPIPVLYMFFVKSSTSYPLRVKETLEIPLSSRGMSEIYSPKVQRLLSFKMITELIPFENREHQESIPSVQGCRDPVMSMRGVSGVAQYLLSNLAISRFEKYK